MRYIAMTSLKLVSIGLISIAAAYVVEAQYGGATHKPIPVADKVSAGPPTISRQDGYHKIYRNSDGIVFKDEKYLGERDKHVSTRYVEEIYPNTRKAAKDVTLTGDLDKATGLVVNVTKQEEVYYDEQGNKVKVETYTNFNKDDVAQRKRVTEDGVSKNYVRDAATNEWVLETEPTTPPKKTTTGIGSLGGIGSLHYGSKKGCLYGKWRSADFNIGGMTGGDGILLTINEDDTVSIDYDAMVQIRRFSTYTNLTETTLKHRGKGSAKISVNGGLITLVKNGDTDIVTVAEIYYYNPSSVDSKRSVTKGLGPVFLGHDDGGSGITYPTSYSCKDNGLQLSGGGNYSTSFLRVQ